MPDNDTFESGIQLPPYARVYAALGALAGIAIGAWIVFYEQTVGDLVSTVLALLLVMLLLHGATKVMRA